MKPTRRGFLGLLVGLVLFPKEGFRPKEGIINTWIDGYPINPPLVRVRGKSIPTQSIRIRPIGTIKF